MYCNTALNVTGMFYILWVTTPLLDQMNKNKYEYDYEQTCMASMQPRERLYPLIRIALLHCLTMRLTALAIATISLFQMHTNYTTHPASTVDEWAKNEAG